MSIDKLKTKFSTGAFVADVKHYFSKINEIIDYLNGVSGNGSYKVYTALLTQSGTNAPVATIFNNTLGGNPVFSYVSVGLYRITLVGKLTANKRFIFFGLNRSVDGANGEVYESDLVVENDDIIEFSTLDSAGASSNEWIKRIEIRIYN